MKEIAAQNILSRWLIRPAQRVAYYIRKRELPYLYWVMRRYFFAFLVSPSKTIRLMKRMRQGKIDLAGFELQIFGPRLLKDTLRACKKHDIKAFLLYGTLLGCIREGKFIDHDHDIDLGVIKERDFDKRYFLLDDLVLMGYKVAWDDEYRMSFEHPRFGGLHIDIDFVYKKDGQRAISIKREDREKVYTSFFPKTIFSQLKKYQFENNQVYIPYKFEKFLEVVYGQWKQPKTEYDSVESPLNIKVE